MTYRIKQETTTTSNLRRCLLGTEQVAPVQMDLVAGRVHRSSASKMTISGEILVNNEPMNPATFRKASAYVQQQDDLPSTETVRECLTFSAQLRLPDSLSNAERKERVESIIAELVCAYGPAQNRAINAPGGSLAVYPMLKTAQTAYSFAYNNPSYNKRHSGLSPSW